MNSGLVTYAQPDYLYSNFAVPNDPAYSGYPGPQWSLPKIGAEQAWNLTVGSSSVVIAVADSGADLTHPEFAPNLWNGSHKNFLASPPSNNVNDDFGHGSHVASIVGARGNNAYDQNSQGGYMTGVSWYVSPHAFESNELFGERTVVRCLRSHQICL
jgi:subtilisin family serine protease